MTRTRRTRRTAALAATATALAALAAATAAPAAAGDTLVTFTVGASGALSLSAPASLAIAGTATGGGALSSPLGGVTVTDSRNNPASSWAATVSVTDPRLDGGSATIPRANVFYTPGAPTREQGVAVVVPSVTTSSALASVLPVVTGTVTSASTVTWTPTLEVRVPAGTPAGTYSMTVTHSVS